MMTDKKDKSEKDPKWSTTAKVGAGLGSAALVAALLYAGKRSMTQKKGKLEPESPEPDTKIDLSKQPKMDTD
jgi:homoserine acetyltransferase